MLDKAAAFADDFDQKPCHEDEIYKSLRAEIQIPLYKMSPAQCRGRA